MAKAPLTGQLARLIEVRLAVHRLLQLIASFVTAGLNQALLGRLTVT